MRGFYTAFIAFLLFFSHESLAYQFQTKAAQAIVLESDTVLFAHDADLQVPPSSMSKMMTLYIAFDLLKSGVINMNDKYQVSKKAYELKGASMFLREGQMVTVRDLLHGIIVASGNDACVVLAEGIAGSQENFVHDMNEMAHKLGLQNSHFVTVNGWPNPNHLMSVKDIALLSKHIYQDFPEYYHLFAIRNFSFNGVSQTNRNFLLNQDIGVDGIKTGHTDSGGYGIAVSAEQDGRRIFVVVNGLKSEAERNSEAKRLVKYAFSYFDTKVIINKGDVVENANVWYGKDKTVPLVVDQDVVVSYARNVYDKIKIVLSYDDIIPAPIKAGQKIGEIQVQVPDFEDKVFPVYAGKSVKQLGYFERLRNLVF